MGEEWSFTETFSETDEIVCCVNSIHFIDFAWSPRDLKQKTGGVRTQKKFGGRVVVHRNFFETDEIVCCVISIDFIDFAWSPRDL